jgi:hypothetical protein
MTAAIWRGRGIASRVTLAEVATVNVVDAVPFVGVTAAGLKTQVIPAMTGQENVTLFVKPFEGATVSTNCVD